ncbi:uncharacterized protein LOC143450438 [Clavelina lepadiformis]|uniref:uncharacterized protein LOC143450438 n=1 Tax=Clavelina lepadiformis TaxID=159417 RepID=UPI004042AC96
MEFKFPKGFLRESSQLSPQKRPQPSPLKHEQFLKDLGLDDDDTLADISSPSDDDSSDETRPSEIEFSILQKELYSCTQQRDALQEKNRELQKSVHHLKSRLKKEERSKCVRLKIVQRAHSDGLKDKQNLIVNLQELIEENGDPTGLKMVSSIELLHEQKAELYKQLIRAQEDHEMEMNLLEERLECEGGTVATDQHTSELLEELKEEKSKLVQELEVTRRSHAEEVRKYEDSLKKKDSELTRNKQDQEEKKRSDDSFRKKLDNLTAELDSCKMNHLEKERELHQIIQRQKEDLRRLENDRDLMQNESESLEREMMSRLTDQKALSNEATVKLSEENRRLLKDLERSRSRVKSLEDENAWMERMREEKEDQEDKNRELETKIKKLESSLEKHKISSKEKLQSLEEELDESRSLLQQHRREASNSYDELKKMMQLNEKQLKQEIEDVQQEYEALKLESDRTIKRLEDNLSKVKEKSKLLSGELSTFKSELSCKNLEVASLQDQVQMKGEDYEKVAMKLTTVEQKLLESEKRTDELIEIIDRNKIEKENYQGQLAALSGESDTALALKEKETGQLRIELNSCQTRLQAETRKYESLQKKFSSLESELDSFRKESELDLIKHRGAVSSLTEAHKHEILKLKASSAISTQNLTTKASAYQKALNLCLTNLKHLTHDNLSLKREVEKFPRLLKDAIKQAAKQISDAVSEINESHKDLIRKYRKEMKLRKKYHNELVELKGNIRVFVRTRPTIGEDGPKPKIAVSYDDNDDSLINVNNSQKGRIHSFEVDRVFTPQSTQDEVYAEVQSLVTSCMDGYHVCIFAYGQTGSGKTYTMEGSKSNPGINQRALNDLFRLIDEKSEDWDFNVAVSLVEIYNETLRDLLNSKSEKLEIKMNADGSLFVSKLRSMPVNDLGDVNKLFQAGRSNRATASTNMNEHSSRSHAVLIITVTGKNKTTGIETLGKLNLIDLAGSERVSKSGASGDRLKEAQNINRSLSALGDVIHALRNKQSHVPFRNSKLTYLLQDSLSKESKTLMLVQVSPIERSIGETVCSLTFAQRVRAVELGQATKKVK